MHFGMAFQISRTRKGLAAAAVPAEESVLGVRDWKPIDRSCEGRRRQTEIPRAVVRSSRCIQTRGCDIWHVLDMLTSWQDLPTDSTVATDEMRFDMAIQKDFIRALDVASGVQAQKRELEGQPGILRRK